MPKVFVTQVPYRKDSETGAFVPSINITTANEHGELIVMMPPRAPFVGTTELIEQLDRHLRRYDFEAGDALLPLQSDTTVAAAAAGYLGKHFGRFRVLKWDRNLGRYVPSVLRFQN